MKIVVPFESHVLVGNKFVILKVAERVCNIEQGLVSRNNAHQTKRNVPKCFPHFYSNIRPSQGSNNYGLFVIQLQLFIVEITGKQILESLTVNHK